MVDLRPRFAVVSGSIPGWGGGRIFSLLSESTIYELRLAFFNLFYPPPFSFLYSLLVSSSLLLCGQETVGSALWRRSPSTLVDSWGSENSDSSE